MIRLCFITEALRGAFRTPVSIVGLRTSYMHGVGDRARCR
jgi:hypothetical protein